MYLTDGQPNIITYNNEVATYPAYTVLSGITIARASGVQKSITVTASKTAFRQVQVGQYILLDTGDQTSQIIKVIGVNRAEFKIITDTLITVTPVDTTLRIVDTIPFNDFSIYNNGVADVYLNGQPIPSLQAVEFDSMEGKPPVVLYGSSSFQVSNGKVMLPPGSVTGLPGTSTRFAPTTVNALYVEDSKLVTGLLEKNIEVFHNGSRLIETVHYDRNLAANRLDAIGAFNFSLTADIYITIFYS